MKRAALFQPGQDVGAPPSKVNCAFSSHTSAVTHPAGLASLGDEDDRSFTFFQETLEFLPLLAPSPAANANGYDMTWGDFFSSSTPSFFEPSGEEAFDYEKEPRQDSQKELPYPSSAQAKEIESLASFQAQGSQDLQQNLILQKQATVEAINLPVDIIFPRVRGYIYSQRFVTDDAIFKDAVPYHIPLCTRVNPTAKNLGVLTKIGIEIGKKESNDRYGSVRAFGISDDNILKGIYVSWNIFDQSKVAFLPFLPMDFDKLARGGAAYPPLHRWVSSITNGLMSVNTSFFITEYEKWFRENTSLQFDFRASIPRDLLDWNKVICVATAQGSAKKPHKRTREARAAKARTSRLGSFSSNIKIDNYPGVTTSQSTAMGLFAAAETLAPPSLLPPVPPLPTAPPPRTPSPPHDVQQGALFFPPTPPPSFLDLDDKLLRFLGGFPPSPT